MKIIDVGAGFFKYPGAVSIDSNPNSKPDIVHDLNIYPWPIKDNEFDMLYTSHCLEHLKDAKAALHEIWRIGKPSAKVIIKLPHFSSRIAWTDIEHVRAFGMHMLRGFTPEYKKISNTNMVFKIEKITLRWQPRIDMEFVSGGSKLVIPFVKAVDAVINFFANLSVDFCERVWCYYVGGIGEIEFHAVIVKE
jgi:predicted SAM-dependent methyltransferase